MPQYGFPKALHLRSPLDFRRVYETKCSVRDGSITVYGRANGLDHPRLGLSVSARIGPAIRRNRLRRLYREAFRLTQTELPAGIDLVVIPRTGDEPALEDLKKSLPRLAHTLARKLADRK